MSLEVSPHLARDTQGSIDEARRLWSLVDRPNLLIKIPATDEGIPAIERLLSDGINVNVTLMFSMEHYEVVAQAYLRAAARCADPSRLASVASFFVSRVDSRVDADLAAIGTAAALDLRGRIAVDNAKLAYRRFGELFSSDGFDALRAKGTRPQRVLWASTSTKDPSYSDVLYVEELIGPETVNTMPPETVEAFRDHGVVEQTLGRDLPGVENRMRELAALGIDLHAVTQDLQAEGVEKFSGPFDDLLATLGVEARFSACGVGLRGQVVTAALPEMELHLGPLKDAVIERLATWRDEHFSKRLWDKEAKLWPNNDAESVRDRLGWLDLPRSMPDSVPDLVEVARLAHEEGLDRVVLLGMGGSSLAPELFQGTFGALATARLTVLDSTHPDAVLSVTRDLEPDRTLFVVSSKSGGTLETLSLFRYFWQRMSVDGRSAGRHFVAITDPGSSLEALGWERDFRAVLLSPSDVGGRYSALTPFGLAPAALLGIDLEQLLERSCAMAEACGPQIPEQINPGLVLGATLGELALRGIDKLTLVAQPGIAHLPDWIEQLVAESTGKGGKGIVPIVGAPLPSPAECGNDRLFIAITMGEPNEKTMHGELQELRDAGHPVAVIRLGSPYDLGAEFFRWELAVAAAGAVLGVEPFDQPDVQLAKTMAGQVMAGDVPWTVQGDILETVPIEAIEQIRHGVSDLLDPATEGYYIAIQAFLEPRLEVMEQLGRLQSLFAARTGLAVTLGIGPRFLHSTGQIHKGGPVSCVFLQFIDRPARSVAVPETDFDFNRLISSQALGDAAALDSRGRRLLRVDLGATPREGLERFQSVLGRG